MNPENVIKTLRFKILLERVFGITSDLRPHKRILRSYGTLLRLLEDEAASKSSQEQQFSELKSYLLTVIRNIPQRYLIPSEAIALQALQQALSHANQEPQFYDAVDRLLKMPFRYVRKPFSEN